MKKSILVSFIAVFFAACQTPVDDLSQDELMLKSADKITLCKEDAGGNFTLVEVNSKAVETHIANGAKLPYSVEGVYYIERDNDKGFGNANWEIFLHDDGPGTFSGEGTGVNANGENVYLKINGFVNEDHSFKMDMFQYYASESTAHGTHDVTGTVAECGGIESLDNDGIFNGNSDYFLISMEESRKVKLCHLDEYGNFISIEVSKNALETHLAHGDKYTYSPEGTYSIERDNDRGNGNANWVITIDNFEGNVFSGSGEGYDANGDAVTVNISGEVFDDHSYSMVMAQYKNGTFVANHPAITGIVSECNGIESIDNNGTFGDKDGDYWLISE